MMRAQKAYVRYAWGRTIPAGEQYQRLQGVSRPDQPRTALFPLPFRLHAPMAGVRALRRTDIQPLARHPHLVAAAGLPADHFQVAAAGPFAAAGTSA